MAFQLKAAVLPPPTSRLGPFREIQRGWQQLEEPCKTRRRLPQKQDVGWESTTCLRSCKDRPDHTASQRSPPLLPLPAFWMEPGIVGNCHDNNDDDKDDDESVRGESAATQRSAGKRPTGVSTDAGGLIEGQWSLYKVYGTATVLSELYLAVLNDLFWELQSG